MRIVAWPPRPAVWESDSSSRDAWLNDLVPAEHLWGEAELKSQIYFEASVNFRRMMAGRNISCHLADHFMGAAGRQHGLLLPIHLLYLHT